MANYNQSQKSIQDLIDYAQNKKPDQIVLDRSNGTMCFLASWDLLGYRSEGGTLMYSSDSQEYWEISSDLTQSQIEDLKALGL